MRTRKDWDGDVDILSDIAIIHYNVCYLKMRIIAAPAWFCTRPGHVINKSKHNSDYNSYKLHTRAIKACLYTFSDPDQTGCDLSLFGQFQMSQVNNQISGAKT